MKCDKMAKKKKTTARKKKDAGLVDEKRREKLIEHIELVMNQYGFVLVPASASVITARSMMSIKTKIEHNERVADIVLKLDDFVSELAEESESKKEGSLFDALVALLYYAIVAHIALVKKNKQYSEMHDASTELVKKLMGVPEFAEAEVIGEEQPYEKDKDFDDPSVR
jgi:hypothetical protein